jgi:hypothetical protein
MSEMANLLLLHQRYTPDDQAIWRTAIQRGWRTERIGTAQIDIERKTLGYKYFRYYGNTMHYENCAQHLPVKCVPIDPHNLTRLPEFTKRKIELLTVEQHGLIVPQKEFLKCPYTKWIESRVYNPGEHLQNVQAHDFLYRQEIIQFTHEIRCFVLDGEILTASYYRNADKEFEPKELFDVPQEVREMAAQIFARCIWPRGVVFDFARLLDGSWAFIEANEAWASGLYDCNPEGCFQVIIASED